MRRDVSQHVAQLAILEHFSHDITATDKIAVYVELRDGGPVAVFLDALADVGISQNVDAFIRYVEMIENLHDGGRKAALGKARGAFHKKHNVLAVNFFFEKLSGIVHGWVARWGIVHDGFTQAKMGLQAGRFVVRARVGRCLPGP